MSYSYDQTGKIVIQTNDDGSTMYIPTDPANRHYQEVLDFIASGGVVAPYVAPAQTWAGYQAEARAMLASTDIVVTRIAEAVSLGHTTFGAADVVAYMQYRRDLRAIISASTGTPQANLPLMPAYPAGT